MSDDDAMDRLSDFLNRIRVRERELSYEEIVREYERMQDELMDDARRKGHELDLRRRIAEGIYFATKRKDCGLAECWRRFHALRALGYDNVAIDVEHLSVSMLAQACYRHGDTTGLFEFFDPVLDRLRANPKEATEVRILTRFRAKLKALEADVAAGRPPVEPRPGPFHDDPDVQMGHAVSNLPLRATQLSYDDLVRLTDRVLAEFLDYARSIGEDLDVRRRVAEALHVATEWKQQDLAECWRRFRDVRALGYPDDDPVAEVFSVQLLARACLRHGDPTGVFEFIDPVLARSHPDPDIAERAEELAALRAKLQEIESTHHHRTPHS